MIQWIVLIVTAGVQMVKHKSHGQRLLPVPIKTMCGTGASLWRTHWRLPASAGSRRRVAAACRCWPCLVTGVAAVPVRPRARRPGAENHRIVHFRYPLWSGWALTMTHLLRATREGRSVKQNRGGAILMPVLWVSSIAQYFIITSTCIKIDLLLQIFVGILYQILSKCVQQF